MEKLKKILHRLLFPGKAVVILSVPVGMGLLLYTFFVTGDNSPTAYVSYMVSAYALVLVGANLVPMIRRGKGWMRKNPYIRRYKEDIPFKMRMSLYGSLAVNLLYAGVNVFSGVYYHSPWFGSLAAYYIFLSVMRFFLVRYAQRHEFGENKVAEWRRYRLCGFVLMMMNMTLAGLMILVISQNKGFEYTGNLIYLMALYTFYITIVAVINVLRYRKYHSPVMSAAKTINLVAALMSMLSLETAMLTQFGSKDTAAFRQMMTGMTGGGVCVFVVGMSIYMMVKATRQLRNHKAEI